MRMELTDAELSKEEKYLRDTYGITYEVSLESLHGLAKKECSFHVRKGVVLLVYEHLSFEMMVLMCESIKDSMDKFIQDLKKRQKEPT